MTAYPLHAQRREALQQQPGQGDERLILGIGEGLIISAFQFDAYRKIITVFAAVEQRHPSVPGAVQARDELRHPTVTLDQKVRGHPQVGNPLEIGMLTDIETVLEEGLHLARGKLRGRQADVVDDQQRDFATRALVEVG